MTNKLCVDCPSYGSFALFACPLDCAGLEDTENQVEEEDEIPSDVYWAEQKKLDEERTKFPWGFDPAKELDASKIKKTILGINEAV